MTLKNLLVCAFAATMSFMTTNAFAADDEWVVVSTPYDDPNGTVIDWNTENCFPGENKGIKDVQVGDKIRFTYDVIDASPQMQIVVKVGAGWTWTEVLGKFVDVPTDGVFEFDIKDYEGVVTGAVLADALSNLNRPLIIKGQALAITKIEHLRKASNVKEYITVNSTDITNGEVANWNSMVTVPASAFTGLKVGDIIDIIMDTKDGAQIQYAVKKDETESGWTQLVDYADVSDSYSIVVEGTITNEQADPVISISAEDFVTAATSYGMFLKGHDYTVTKVVVKRLKDPTGIGCINADNNIDENKPVEIYSIDGRKMQNTNVHGIYILRQGNKTIKVMK